MSSLLAVSQKCQYALRGLFELAIRFPADRVTTVSEIAETQNIPPRFLEQILSNYGPVGILSLGEEIRGGI